MNPFQPTTQGVNMRKFINDICGLGAVEFALVFPIITFLMLAGFDFGRYLIACQRIEAASYNIAQMLSQTQPNVNAIDAGDGIVFDTDIQWYHNSAMFTFPDVLEVSFQQQLPWDSLMTVNMTSIKFIPAAGCTSNCTYTPKVVWSTGNRPCTTVFTQVPDSSVPGPTILPADLYGPASQLIVDISYTFQPTIGAAFLSSISINRTIYMTPRNVSLVETSNSTLAPTCTGAL